MVEEALAEEFVEDDTQERTEITSGFTVNDIIALTARLAYILAQEVDHLEAMEIEKISDMHDEKVAITNVLKDMKGRIDRKPEILDELSDQERADLREVVTVFQTILDENYRRLSMARAVNQKVVETIKEVVKDTSASDAYDENGSTNQSDESVSLSLNEKV